jgi:hypothetical protein
MRMLGPEATTSAGARFPGDQRPLRLRRMEVTIQVDMSRIRRDRGTPGRPAGWRRTPDRIDMTSGAAPTSEPIG